MVDGLRLCFKVIMVWGLGLAGFVEVDSGLGVLWLHGISDFSGVISRV